MNGFVVLDVLRLTLWNCELGNPTSKVDVPRFNVKKLPSNRLFRFGIGNYKDLGGVDFDTRERGLTILNAHWDQANSETGGALGEIGASAFRASSGTVDFRSSFIDYPEFLASWFPSEPA